MSFKAPRDTGAGMVPPQSIEIEQAVLGAMLVDDQSVYEVLQRIKTPDVFYKEEHKIIFKAMLDLMQKNMHVDMITVSEAVKGGVPIQVITDLATKVASAGHLETHVLLLLQYYAKRQIIMMSSEMMGMAYSSESDVFDVLAQARKYMAELDTSLNINVERTWHKVLEDMALDVQTLTDNPAQMMGIDTGYKKLNERTGGWRPGLVIVAARPGMGKSAFVVGLAHSAAKQGKRVAFFTLEMTDVQVAKRFVSNVSDIHSRMLYVDGLQKEGYVKRFIGVVDELASLPIEVIQSPGIDISTMAYKCYQMRDNGGLDMIVVDYIQIMESLGSRNENREQQISGISRGLKKLSLELNVPVIALSQLSRKVDERSSKRPMLSDLRESGAIEQDADIVMFLFRPGYYVENNTMRPDSVDVNVVEVIVAKNRNGEVGSWDIGWDSNRTRMYDLDVVNNQYDEVL